MHGRIVEIFQTYMQRQRKIDNKKIQSVDFPLRSVYSVGASNRVCFESHGKYLFKARPAHNPHEILRKSPGECVQYIHALQYWSLRFAKSGQ